MVVKLILLNSEEKAQCIDSARFDVIILVKNKPSLVIQHEGSPEAWTIQNHGINNIWKNHDLSIFFNFVKLPLRSKHSVFLS